MAQIFIGLVAGYFVVKNWATVQVAVIDALNWLVSLISSIH